MTNFDDNTRRPGYGNGLTSPTRSSGSWIALAVIVAIIVIGGGYLYTSGWMTPGMTEHRAAATDDSQKPAMAPTQPTATTKP